MYTMKLNNWVLYLFFLILIASCGGGADEEPQPPLDPDLGKTYFFLVQGKYREYNVYEIRYSGVDISDTSEYQIREEVGEPFSNSRGQVSHLINRYRRENTSESWQLDSVWTARIEDNKAISVENNLPLVKMLFPADTISTWDRNLFNSKEPRVQRFKNFNSQFTVRLNTFLRTAEIEISNEEDGITFRDIRKEVYRDSIGLIYKLYDEVKLCSRQECLGQQLVESGRFYREELIAHGFIDEEN